jgi:hypothetical protein
LEKAILQIEEAIKKSRGGSTGGDGNSVEELQKMLEAARNNLPFGSSTIALSSTIPAPEADAPGPSSEGSQSNEEHLSLDDAENPLQLLARASGLQLSSPQSSDAYASPSTARHYGSERDDKVSIHQFFLPMKAGIDIDGRLSAEADPIAIGLVTIEEAQTLFSLYVLATRGLNIWTDTF